MHFEDGDREVRCSWWLGRYRWKCALDSYTSVLTRGRKYRDCPPVVERMAQSFSGSLREVESLIGGSVVAKGRGIE